MDAEIRRDEFQACFCSIQMVLDGDWAPDHRREWSYLGKPLGLISYVHVVPAAQLAEGIAFIRADDPKLFPDSKVPFAEDSTSGPECPDLELFATPLGYTPDGVDLTAPAFGVHAVALRPTSLGNLRLRSNDPFDSPVIDPRFVGNADTHPRY